MTTATTVSEVLSAKWQGPSSPCPWSGSSTRPDIVARVEQGDKAKDRADQMYLSAGLQLIEAKRRAPISRPSSATTAAASAAVGPTS